MSSKLIEDSIKDSPEYFTDELEYRRKWDLIPQQVHDEYLKERAALNREIYKDMPPSKGILEWINNIEEYQNWCKKYDECRKKEIPLAKKLHELFYKKYGIEFNEC